MKKVMWWLIIHCHRFMISPTTQGHQRVNVDDDYEQLLHEHIKMLEERFKRYENIAMVSVPTYSMMISDLPRTFGVYDLVFAGDITSGESGGGSGLGE